MGDLPPLKSPEDLRVQLEAEVARGICRSGMNIESKICLVQSFSQDRTRDRSP